MCSLYITTALVRISTGVILYSCNTTPTTILIACLALYHMAEITLSIQYGSCTVLVHMFIDSFTTKICESFVKICIHNHYQAMSRLQWPPH